MLSRTEENYLKTIYQLTQSAGGDSATTSSIARALGTSSASVTDMIKKLADKGLIEYERYYGVDLTRLGQKLALSLIRKHRLWEVFLFEKLGFPWDEIHGVAEQLEHVDSALLIQRLDAYLGNPKFDPHGDPIPNEQGNLTYRAQMPLSQAAKQAQKLVVVGVKDQSPEFLKYLVACNIVPGSILEVDGIGAFDQSIKVRNEMQMELILSEAVSKNILVKFI